MVVAGHVKLLALDLACQRLARRAKAMATVGAALELSKCDEVDRLVGLALTALGEASWKASPAVDPKKKPSGGLLMRMLRGKDEEQAAPVRTENSAPSPEHRVALRGESDCVPPPDLLGFLSAQRKTGTLEVVTPTEVFTLEFESGDVVHAHVNPTIPQQRLGDILVANGWIDRDALEKLRKEGLSQRLGEMLLKSKLVTRQQLITALQTQVQLLFNRMFAAPVSRFTFWNGPPVLADQGMRLNAMALILEGARKHDERGHEPPGSSPNAPPDWIAAAEAASAFERKADRGASAPESGENAGEAAAGDDPVAEAEAPSAEFDAMFDGDAPTIEFASFLDDDGTDPIEPASLVDDVEPEPDTVEDKAG